MDEIRVIRHDDYPADGAPSAAARASGGADARDLHVVVGAGAIGSGIARELAGRGHRVRLVTRSGSGLRPAAGARRARGQRPARSARPMQMSNWSRPTQATRPRWPG